MKGIILAGGTGTRLYPLTKYINKHLIPIGKYPLIYYPIYKLKGIGIVKILIITGKEHLPSIVNLLGNGSENGLDFSYRIQDQPGGIAQALSLAEDFAGNDRSVVILGDNIFSADLGGFVEDFRKQPAGAKVLLKEVSDPQRFGVAEVKGDKVVNIEEKPAVPKSNYCVTGIYMYDCHVFEIIRSLKPSQRGELEITDVNNVYIKDGLLTYGLLEGWWIDAGTYESQEQAVQLIKEKEIIKDFYF